MTHDLRFLVGIMPNSDFDTMLRRFKHAEDLGFDMATTGDHFVDWTNPQRPWLEACTALAGIARETLVRALEPVLVCEIARENFERYLDRCPTVGIRILKKIGGRLRYVESKFSDLVFHNAPARLAKLLLQLSETMGERDQGRIRLNVRLTHQNLANLIGTSRETVSALLGQFQRQRLVTQDHRHICLLDTDGLANIQ